MWLDEGMDSDSVYSARSTYEKVFRYLELNTIEGRTADWDAKYDEAVEDEKNSNEDK